jgi:hypothetical protein
MAHAWTEQQQHAALTSLGFDERFGLLVDAEWLARDNKRVTRALKEAKLKLPTPVWRLSTIRPGASSTRPSSASSPPAAGCRSTTT